MFLSKKAAFLPALVLSFLISNIFGFGDEWRPITPEDLATKTPKVEPDADAEIMFEEIRIDDSSDEDLSMKHYLRVKIFTERGREKFSKFDIPFYKGKKIKDIAARVIRPDGTIVEIKKDDIFEREIIKANGLKIKAKSFAIPGIDPGVIVEYRYREIIEDAGANGMRLTFQRDLPAQNLSYYYKPNNGKEPQYQSFNFTDTKFVKDAKGYYLASRNNVPAYKEEPYMPPNDEVRSWMLLQNFRLSITSFSGGFDGYSATFAIKDPSSPQLYWGAVRAEKLPLYTLMAKPDEKLKETAKSLTASASSDAEKLQVLYEFCQKEVKNTDYETVVADAKEKKKREIKTIGDVLKYKEARGLLINLLFGAMTNSLGYPTRIALAANREEKFFDPNMTNDNFIHPAAIAIKLGEEWRFYDPATPYLPSGSLVWFEEGVYAMLFDDKGYTWRQTPYTTYQKSKAIRKGKLKLLEDGTLAGDLEIQYTGQLATTRRREGYDDSEAKRLEDLKSDLQKRLSTAEISNISIENFYDLAKPLIHRYSVKMPGYAQKTGKRLFLQPGFFEYGSTSIFSSASRTYGVYFPFPWSEKDEIEITLPSGYSLDNADSPGLIEDPGKIGSNRVDIGVAADASFLRYDRSFHFGGGNNILFEATAYPVLKKMFDSFHQSDTHSITLKQK